MVRIHSHPVPRAIGIKAAKFTLEPTEGREKVELDEKDRVVRGACTALLLGGTASLDSDVTYFRLT